MSRPAASLVAAAVAALLLAGTGAELAAQSARRGSIPRTADGRPDLQGNWSNATITPVQRMPGQPAVLTPEQVAEIEAGRQEFFEENLQPSDPDRGAPPVGGSLLGDPLFDAAAGGTGGYNVFFIDPGSSVAVVNGEARSSLVTNPPDGRVPALTAAAQQTMAARMAEARRFGEYDNPENRPLSERCLTSFGLNMGPPMLPNYFYNNNYTIVQTPDHVMIMTEMVHDVRVIPIGEPPDVPDHIRPWFGVSWGRWEGDTLVVETTNIRLDQLQESSYVFPGGSENLKVVERFTRADESTLLYEFTVVDPEWYTAEWGGQLPFTRLDGNVYEYACHEANYSLFNVLSGARAEERAAASR